MQKSFVTRFAPSPTGYLHIGHAYAALCAYRRAQEESGQFILRIEDIDTARCRPEHIDALLEDLKWLGLQWKNPVRIQSQHMQDYENAIQSLQKKDLIYPCFCTRKEIQQEISESSSAPHGPDGPLYPGTCRHMDSQKRAEKIATGAAYALRLDMERVKQFLPEDLSWTEEKEGKITINPNLCGDVVLARKDIKTSYHIAVVTDDAIQGITHVIRGTDLKASTAVHRILQYLLNLPEPIYHHHKLIKDKAGERLAKRRGSPTLRDMRKDGVTPKDIYKALGLES